MTAPVMESKPPITTAGRALSADIKLEFVSVLNPPVMKKPANAANSPAMNQTNPNTLPTFIPWAKAASWSREVALIATPYFDFLKKTESTKIRSNDVIKAVTSRYLIVSPPIFKEPKFPKLGNGSPIYFGFIPIQLSNTTRRRISIPIVNTATENTGFSNHGS